MANAHFVRGSQRRPVTIIEVPALDQNRQALTRLLAQCIGRTLHKVGIDDGLVVIQKHNRVVPQHRRAGKTHVADGAVAAQAHALARAFGRNLCHAVGNTRSLSIGNDGDLKCGMRINDFVHAMRYVGRGRNRTDHQENDARNVAHLFERSQAAIEFRVGGIERRRVIVGAGSVCLGIIARPICWDHNRGVHTFTLLATQKRGAAKHRRRPAT